MVKAKAVSGVEHSSQNLSVALALFELEYPESSIEAALAQNPRTVEDALEWLGAKGSHTVAEVPTPLGMKENVPNSNQQRRRLRKKGTDDQVPVETIAVAAGQLLTLAAAAAAANDEDVQSTDQDPAGRVLEIFPAGDASLWWREAATRWQRIVTELQAGRSLEDCLVMSSVEVMESPSSKLCVSPLAPLATQTPGKRKASEIAPSCDDITYEEVNDSTDAASGGQQQALDSTATTSPDVQATAAASPEPHDDSHVTYTVETSAAARTPVSSSLCASKRHLRRSAQRRVSLTPASSPRPLQYNRTDTEVCGICCDDIPRMQAVRLKCGHGWYCFQCMKSHAEARLDMGNTSVSCPECNQEIVERVLRKLLPEEVVERLLARSLEQAVSSASNLWACPTPNCPMRVALEEDEEARLKCSECKRESCLRCGAQPFHKNLTCEEYAKTRRKKLMFAGKRQRLEKDRIDSEESLMQWIKETGTKQCPKCKMAVSKQNLDNQNTQYSECHKMYCRNCNTKFCFKCLTVFTETVTCKCTRADHGFVDWKTGQRIVHTKPKVAVQKLGQQANAAARGGKQLPGRAAAGRRGTNK